MALVAVKKILWEQLVLPLLLLAALAGVYALLRWAIYGHL